MARKIKLPDTVVRHENVNVRLAVVQLEHAVAAAKKGNVEDMATYIRLAHMFEQDIPNEIRFPTNIPYGAVL
jgi:hypothetical protein